jgi:hypothetical protein
MAMLKFRAPPLPLASLNYNQDNMAQLIRALTLYFNQLDSTTPVQWEEVNANFFKGGFYTGDGSGLTLPHIAASDESDQYAPANNTETKVLWSALDSGSGFTLNANSTATANKRGIYKMTYSLQFANTSSDAQYVWVWAEINGVDVPRSATQFFLPARKSVGEPSHICAYSELCLTLTEGQTVGLYWATSTAMRISPAVNGVYMEYKPAQVSPFPMPSIPSAIGSITFIGENNA